jgi:transposase InsO family protein
VLRREGCAVNRKRVRRLMRLMGLRAIYQKPNTSRQHPEHKVYRNHRPVSIAAIEPTNKAFLRPRATA